VVPNSGGGSVCPETAKWSATYTVTAPEPAYAVQVEGATMLCRAASPCAPPEAYPAETAVKASLEKGTEAVLKTNLVNVKCPTSTAEGKTTAESGEPLPGEVTALSFSGCKTEGGTTCTVTTQNLPYAASLKATGEGNGTLTVTNPSVKVVCGFVLSCAFGTEPLEVKGGAPAKVIAKEVVPNSGGGSVCPETAKWSATYTVTAPEPAYAVK
jgi:hypothetical protein